MSHLLIDAAFGKSVERPPIWIMRQAGRYMTEYNEIRKNIPFLDLCKNVELSTKVAMLPMDMLDVDAAILFSDILVTADAMGGKLDYIGGVGPTFSNPIATRADLATYSTPDPYDKLKYVYDIIGRIKEELDGTKPIIGFAGAPFTVASYLIEGTSSKDLKKTKIMMYRDPELFHAIMEKLTVVTIDYLNMQIDAGVDAIQIFDSWAMHLAHNEFKEYSLYYMKRIIDGLKNRDGIPIIVFARGSSAFYDLLTQTGADVISVDWNANLSTVQRNIGSKFTVQGNLDPFVLYGTKDIIKREAYRILDEMAEFPGFIFNLGHGVTPDMPFENVKYLVDLIKDYRK